MQQIPARNTGLRPLRRLLIAAMMAGVAGLGACGREDPPFPPAPVRSAASAPATAAVTPPTYVGRWAAAPSACADKAWVIQSASLQSPGALSCSLDRVRPTLAGYVANGVCHVGSAAAPGRLVFTFYGSGASSGLTMDGGPFTEPMPLVRCGQSAQAAPSSSERQG